MNDWLRAAVPVAMRNAGWENDQGAGAGDAGLASDLQIHGPAQHIERPAQRHGDAHLRASRRRAMFVRS